MKLRTPIELDASELNINHKNSLFLVGSCFATEIGSQLAKRKFNCLINPMGISYNPISLHDLLNFDNLDSTLSDHTTDLHFNYQFHSSFNALSAVELQNKIRMAKEAQRKHLAGVDYIFITYGTAIIYELKSSGLLVNNCHKQSSNLFQKRKLDVEEIEQSWDRCLKTLMKTCKESVQIIFTVSPIRHLKEGFHENQISKSTLLLAIDKIEKAYTNCHYFPSYEILMDDLRDYRFYKKDLIHPNDVATEYMWSKFSEHFFDADTIKQNQSIDKINQAIQHRPFQQDSSRHQDFLKKLLKQIEDIEQKSAILFKKEKEKILEQLN